MVWVVVAILSVPFGIALFPLFTFFGNHHPLALLVEIPLFFIAIPLAFAWALWSRHSFEAALLAAAYSLIPALAILLGSGDPVLFTIVGFPGFASALAAREIYRHWPPPAPQPGDTGDTARH